MKFKLIVGNKRFQVDEISKVDLIYYEIYLVLVVI